MMSVKENIKNSLCLYLVKRNISKKAFAEILGVNRSSVTYWCNGDNIPSVELFPLICSTLEISINDFLGIDSNYSISEEDHELLVLISSLSSVSKASLVTLIKSNFK